MHPEWANSFAAFLRDVGERPSLGHSIDRIDNTKGYVPGNVRWATRSEQGRNKRTNRLITHNGVTACVAEWAQRTGLKERTIHTRLARGKTPAEALSTTLLVHPLGFSPERNRLLTVDGKILSMSAWAAAKGMEVSTLHSRLKTGWSPERAVMTPVKVLRKRSPN